MQIRSTVGSITIAFAVSAALGGAPDAGPLPERGNCEVHETDAITSQIRH
jgi:hypothetical protein